MSISYQEIEFGCKTVYTRDFQPLILTGVSSNAFFNVFEKKSLNHLQILVFVHIFASEFYLLVKKSMLIKPNEILIYSFLI